MLFDLLFSKLGLDYLLESWIKFGTIKALGMTKLFDDCHWKLCVLMCLILFILGWKECIEKLSLTDSTRTHLWTVGQSTDHRWGPSISALHICLTLWRRKWTMVRLLIDGSFCTSVVSICDPILWSFLKFLKCPTTEVDYSLLIHHWDILQVRHFLLQLLWTCTFLNVLSVHRWTLSTDSRYRSLPSSSVLHYIGSFVENFVLIFFLCVGWL